MTAARTLPIGESEITFDVVKVTPALAEKWIGKNVRNRNVYARWVKELARMMSDGEWELNGEAVKFSVAGDLLDGQHRLLAVIASGKTVPILVVRGLPAETQDLMDTGRARTAGNMLQIKGFSNSTSMAAAAKLILLHNDGERTAMSSRKVSNRRINEFVSGNSLLAFAVTRSLQVSKTFRMRPATISTAMYLLMQVDEVAAAEFFDRCADGVNLAARSPILALRNRVAANREDRLLVPIEGEISLVVRAWNAWRRKQNLGTLRTYANGELIACPVPK